MRPRLSYANVVATLALVLALSGGAYAAGRYLINSTKQINPKVLKKLRGARGRTGPIGPVGPQGIAGQEGRRGETGKQGERGESALSLLPGGKTESGDFAISTVAGEANGEPVSTAVTFTVPLSPPLEKWEVVKIEENGKAVGAHCSGVGTAPRGYLCIYVSSEENVQPGSGASRDPEVNPPVAGTGRYGALLGWTATEKDKPVRVTGTYAVTAP